MINETSGWFIEEVNEGLNEGLNEGYEWRIWMKDMNEGYEWRIWMKDMNEGYEWRIWMKDMDEEVNGCINGWMSEQVDDWSKTWTIDEMSE
jgi:hypothetical protein